MERIDLFQEDIELKLQWALEIVRSEPPAKQKKDKPGEDKPEKVNVEIEYEIPITEDRVRAEVGEADGSFVLLKRETFSGAILNVGINPDSGNGPYVTLEDEQFPNGFRSSSLSRIRDYERTNDFREDVQPADARKAEEVILGLRQFFRSEQVIPALGEIGGPQSLAKLRSCIVDIKEKKRDRRNSDKKTKRKIQDAVDLLSLHDDHLAAALEGDWLDHLVRAVRRAGSAEAVRVLMEEVLPTEEFSESLKAWAAVAVEQLLNSLEEVGEAEDLRSSFNTWLDDHPERDLEQIRDDARNLWTRLDRPIGRADNYLRVVDPIPAGWTVPFVVKINNEKMKVEEVAFRSPKREENRRHYLVRVTRGINGLGRPHPVGSDIKGVPEDREKKTGHQARLNRLWPYARAAMLLVASGVLAVLLTRKVLLSFEGAEPLPAGKAFDKEIERAHRVISYLLPPGTDVDSTLFQAILYGVPATLILLLLAIGSRRPAEAAEAAEQVGKHEGSRPPKKSPPPVGGSTTATGDNPGARHHETGQDDKRRRDNPPARGGSEGPDGKVDTGRTGKTKRDSKDNPPQPLVDNKTGSSDPGQSDSHVVEPPGDGGTRPPAGGGFWDPPPEIPGSNSGQEQQQRFDPISHVPPMAAPADKRESTSSPPWDVGSPSDEAVGMARKRLDDVRKDSRFHAVRSGMKTIGAGTGRQFLASPVVLVFDGPKVSDGAYPIPRSIDEAVLPAWVKRHPQVPSRASLKLLLSVYGLRLPTVEQARRMFESGAVACPDAPMAVIDEKSRAILPDGRLVYPGDPAEPRANVGQLAVVGVCETVA